MTSTEPGREPEREHGTRVVRPAALTREHVLDVAGELFYARGLRATGVDVVAASAHVTTTTLYRLFGSKDGLVSAYVARGAERYVARFLSRAEAHHTARSRALAVFAGLQEELVEPECRGCPFQIALAELPDPAGEAHRRIVALKAWVRRQFVALAEELLAAHAPDEAARQQLADDLCLVMEGAYASRQALGTDGPARRAPQLAAAVIDAALADAVLAAGQSAPAQRA